MQSVKLLLLTQLVLLTGVTYQTPLVSWVRTHLAFPVVASNLAHTATMLTIGFVAPNARRRPGSRLLRLWNRSGPMLFVSVHPVIKGEGKWNCENGRIRGDSSDVSGLRWYCVGE